MRHLPALLIATTLTGSLMGGTAQAESFTYNQLKGNNQVITKQFHVNNKKDIKDVLKKNGFVIISGNNCPSINIPGGGNSGTDNPGTDKPGTDKPGTDKPGTDNPHPDSSFANQVASLVNKEREKAGLQHLTVKTDITAAAQVRAKEIKTSFSHTRPDGRQFSTTLTENGVSFQRSGENIAYGQSTPEEVMNGWMNSKGHRENILNKNFNSIGVGYYQDASGTAYWTQLFTN